MEKKEQTTVSIYKETREKVSALAKKENRSISAQIDFIINKFLEAQKND